MMKATSLLSQLLILLCAAFLASCHRREASEASLSCIDRQLERHQQWKPIELDSAFTEAVVDIEHNGTPNQRLLAYYLLGYAYYEHGQIEDAQKAYLQAIASADTTAADCDFTRLAKTYAQNASMITDKELMELRLSMIDTVFIYAEKANNRQMMISVIGQKAYIYEMAQCYHEASDLYKKEFRAYEQDGDTIIASSIARNIAACLLFQDEIDSAGIYLRYFEKYSLAPGVPIDRSVLTNYYLTKGKYYATTQKNDSAFAMFYHVRKSEKPNDRARAYALLSNFHNSLGNTDSALIYSNFYNHYCDSINQSTSSTIDTNAAPSQFKFAGIINKTKSTDPTTKIHIWIILLIVTFILTLIIIKIRKIHNCQLGDSAWQHEIETIRNLPEFTSINECLNRNTVLNNNGRELLHKLIVERFPIQHKLIKQKGLKESDKIACELLLLSFPAKDIAILIGLTESAVSRKWTRITKMLFGESYSSKECALRLRSLTKRTES